MIEMFKGVTNIMIQKLHYDPKATIVKQGQTTRSDNKQGNPRITEKTFTLKSTTDWNMLPGKIIDSKLHKKVKEPRLTVT